MKKSQFASIELLNGVSNDYGKRRVSALVKEAGVNVDVKRQASSLHWVNSYFTCMNMSVIKRKIAPVRRA